MISREHATDHTEMVTYLEILLVRHAKIPAGILFSIPFFIFSSERLCIVHSDRAACKTSFFTDWPPSSFVTHKKLTTSKHLSQRALWDQSYLWPPGTSHSLGTDPQSAHASSTQTVTQEIRTGCTADRYAPFLITQTEAIDSALAERRDMSTSHRPSAMSCVVLLFDFDKRRRGSSHFLQPDRAYC